MFKLAGKLLVGTGRTEGCALLRWMFCSAYMLLLAFLFGRSNINVPLLLYEMSAANAGCGGGSSFRIHFASSTFVQLPLVPA
jgi:hypothetical protein